MHNFRSLRTWERNDANSIEEHYFDSAQMIPPAVSQQSVDEIQQLDPFAMVSLTKSTDPLQSVRTEQDILCGPLHDIPTTQSLISALQATIQPEEFRAPVVIPGTRKRLPSTLNTEELTRPGKRLHPHLRLVLVLSAMMGVLAYTLFSFTPLHAEQSGNPLIDGAVSWVVTQQQNWGFIAALGVQPVATAVTTSTTSLVNTATMTLPKSQYIEIAREDAIAAGISPDDFVRQINLESGFNPYAESPAGAEGIAQFEPATAAGLGIDPFNPTQALKGAAQYMARLAAQFGGSYAKAAAAYNAGSGAVQNAINVGGANWLSYLPVETQNYVNNIIA